MNTTEAPISLDPTRARLARAAGILSLCLLVSGSFVGHFDAKTVVPQAAAMSFVLEPDFALSLRLGTLSALVMNVLLLFYALVLRQLYLPVGKLAAASMLVLIAVGVPIAMLNELARTGVLLTVADPSWPFPLEQVHAQARLLLDLHRAGQLMATIFWGLWLFPLGVLVLRSGLFPRWLGLLLLLGGCGYLLRFMSGALGGKPLSLYSPLLVSAHVGEVVHGTWLLVKGQTRRSRATCAN